MKSFRNIPELLLPAGNLDKLNIAYLYGADAVYCGVPRYSLRARENEFSMEDLHTAVTIARNLKKKIYFTVNNIPRNSKLGSYHKYLEQMVSLKPDALIMADPGLIHITKNAYPELEIHISVQTNTMNYAAVEFWKTYGAKRVILSREVSIPEIKEIKDKVPDMEIEVFVHGSICIAHSGRCFMSNYFKNRDANQGSCNNACRDLYKVYVTNPKQNDEPMELITDEDGTFLMNSKDLRAIEFLQELCDAGVDSLKVEGRTKNDFYVGMVARSYRKTLDGIKRGESFDRKWLEELDKLSSRKYFSGFLTRGMEDQIPVEEQNFQNNEFGTSLQKTHHYVGLVKEYQQKNQRVIIEVKNKIEMGDVLEVINPLSLDVDSFVVNEIYYKNNLVNVVSGGIGFAEITVPFEITKQSFLTKRIL
ncbi:peptidase U32 [Leptospira levettii]|uniref:Peptidase U32 n=1 Tax=Leptospira levettii TaxID=2023178 RepID=A0A5F2DC40_9LEPT|nr:U32 family peptidase C-terminal domain-containing protein [Leptospira levettii]MCW7465077.1 U32 family peptidase C-terminal domain-containing protein [Leptospira levettii]MCW7509817.1 U32 family peptidase C-terminal domain-containing protein [Leptospira levettii]MCW7513567.1 U32 family peptidase C-terminal domain-containing protein [Leptospira levettii]TGL67658.1 peptidase U32 [Leptospira levettii]TGM27634.1 peptidase U32 [Leptospira levettii]